MKKMATISQHRIAAGGMCNPLQEGLLIQIVLEQIKCFLLQSPKFELFFRNDENNIIYARRWRSSTQSTTFASASAITT
jgi:hypothetical protein